MKTISYMLSMMMVLLLAAGCTATEAETPILQAATDFTAFGGALSCET